MASSNMILKFLIDKRVQKVLYAEASKEFMDLLFHIFALPLGTLIKFPSSKQMVGCLGKLKESIETLNQTHLQPDHDKPSASKTKTLFMCGGSTVHVSDHHDARCPHCGRLMNVPMTFVRWPNNEEVVVKETVTSSFEEITLPFGKDEAFELLSAEDIFDDRSSSYSSS
ncbi:unnamed protein product [Lactuca virosa]|uniref:Uncharacterized protein n=1 Tax=Lactuca virosa TaxID=75947 RepID=A0AAU9P0I8_9ASTR|nr:unnamed protein product [Lactuca virosa]